MPDLITTKTIFIYKLHLLPIPSLINIGQIRVRVKGKKSKLKYTSINGIDTYIYLTYSLSGLAKYQIYDYDFLKFRNHLKENLSFWGDNIPLINPKKQCLGVYFFYDYKVKQVRLTGKP